MELPKEIADIIAVLGNRKLTVSEKNKSLCTDRGLGKRGGARSASGGGLSTNTMRSTGTASCIIGNGKRPSVSCT